MGTRVSYPIEVKIKAIELRLVGTSIKQVEELNIRNYSQLKTWMKWYKNGKLHCLLTTSGKIICLWERT